MEPDIAEIRKNYERMDDARIIRLASEEADGLRPEAQALLKQIIKERGLPEIVSRSLDVQTQELDENALTGYCELLRKLPCPLCNSTTEKLNGNVVAQGSYYTKDEIVACPACLDKAFINANQNTLLFGWRNIFGIINLPRVLVFNKKMKAFNHINDASDTLKSFVSTRAGRIELYRNDPEGLSDIILFPRG